jgi:hypothetical protein
MESLTLLFVSGMAVAAILLTLLVRKDFSSREKLERERRRQTARRVRGR